MAEIRYNIGDLFQQEFGERPVLPYALPQRGETPANVNLTGISTVQMTKHGVISTLGTPVMFPVWFKGGNYNKYTKDGELITVSINNDLLLPFTTMVDFRRSKIRVNSPAASGYGAVTETYGVNDWSIRIRGFILSEEEGKFNKRAIEDLYKFEQLIDAVGVVGEMFSILDIHKIKIDDIQLPKTVGKPNVQPFMMEAYSDIPVELII